MLSDMTELEEKLKTQYFGDSIKNTIKRIVEEQLPPELIETRFSLRLGNIGRILRHILDMDINETYEFAMALLEAGSSKEAVNFLIELASGFGEYFTDFRRYMHFPDGFEVFISVPIYDPRTGLAFKIRILKREGAVSLEGSDLNFTSLAESLLRAVLEGYEKVKEDVPSVKLEVSKEDLTSIKDYIRKMEEATAKKHA